MVHSLSLSGPLTLSMNGTDSRPGYRVLQSLLSTGEQALANLRSRTGRDEVAGFGRLRGTGPGVSFAALAAELEEALPRELVYPFEGSQRVGGAVWMGSLLQPALPSSLAKLRWEAGADDLPMHVHEHSDRCIFVLEGRGYFHASPDRLATFSGKRVHTIAARERDMFVFTRGVVHTFSTLDHPMTLLSCQLPFLPFQDPRQYTLPRSIWTARDQLCRAGNVINLDWSYAVLGCG